MTAQSLQTSGTHHSKFKGATESRVVEPTNTGAAGLRGGERYYNTGNNRDFVQTATSDPFTWKYAQMTTTSTTTS